MFSPGEIVPTSGIYKCSKCGNGVTCVKGEPFPPGANGCAHPTYYLVTATH